MDTNIISKLIMNIKSAIILSVSIILILEIQIANAQENQPPNMPHFQPISPFDNYTSFKGNPHESPRKFERYAKDKYKQIYNAESDVKQTPHGPSGSIWLTGEIVPQKKAAIDLTKEKGRHVRARAIVKAFMDDESTLLGITNAEEIREANILTSTGFNGDYTNIYYKRYINDVELGTVLRITIGPSENISGVDASLVPVPPEVYEATKKKTLSEEEVRSIVEADLEKEHIQKYKDDEYVKIYKKIVVIKQPYVIWDVFYYYIYKIDAFTGDILSKISPIRGEQALPATRGSSHTYDDTQPPMPPPAYFEK